MTKEELYNLAVNFKPFTEKDRAKRTADTMAALLKLQEYQEILSTAIDKLKSGTILHESDASAILNTNVPEISSLMRPHAMERHWKIRYDAAIKIVEKDDANRQYQYAESRANLYQYKYKPIKKLAEARAFLQIFSVNPEDYWKKKPSKAWADYFERVYHSNPDEE